MLLGFEACRVDGTDMMSPLCGSVAFRINETHSDERSFRSVAVPESPEKWSSEAVGGARRKHGDGQALLSQRAGAMKAGRGFA